VYFLLDNKTSLFEDEFTEKEYETVRSHQKNTKNHAIQWHSMMCAWRDKDGILCVQYANQESYHYSEKGEWW